MKKNTAALTKLVTTGVMAAIVCVVTFLRFPLLGSKVHFANALCLVSGLLLGPVYGGAAAGLGSFLYDAMFGGYDILQCLITFVSKFAMAWACVMLARPKKEEKLHARVILGSIVGSLLYVALYMLKTYVFQRFVYGFPLATVWVTMLEKLPASLINAVAAMIAAPIIYSALRPALSHAGLLKKLQ